MPGRGKIQFCLGYSTDTPAGAKWVFDPQKIRRHYLRSWWFVLDSFSIASSGFDFMPPGSTQGLSGLRAVRVLRLLKLMRLLRGSQIFRRYMCIRCPRTCAMMMNVHEYTRAEEAQCMSTTRTAWQTNMCLWCTCRCEKRMSINYSYVSLIRHAPICTCRWEKRMSINYSYLSLARLATAIIFCCHW